MGYFSEIDIRNFADRTDRTYNGFEEQLLSRYNDLCDRYDALSLAGAPMYDGEYLSRNDLRFAPVGYFTSLSAVHRAMEVARAELEERCGITPEGIAPTAEKEEVDPNQLSIFEVIVIPHRIARPVAA